MPDTPPGSRRLRLVEAAVLVLAAVLRLAGLAGLGRTRHAEGLLVDAHLYWTQAGQLVAGEEAFGEGLYQPPGYPLFLAALRALGGELDAVRGVQAVLGLLSTWLVLRLGRRVGEGLGAPGLGALAALITTLSPTLLLFEQDLLTPALGLVLLLLALELAAPLWRGAGGPARAGLLGVLLGLGAVVHGTALFAAGALLLAVASLRRWLCLAALLAGLALSLAPTTAVNLERHGRLALVSHNGGLNAWLGNNPEWKHTHFVPPGVPFRELVMAAEPWQRDLAERDAWWWDRVRGYALGSPGSFLGGLATKAMWSVSDVEIRRNEDMRCRLRLEGLRWLGWLPARWGLVFPLAVAGAAVLLRGAGASREGRVVVGLWAALHLGVVLFLVADRYRLSAWPLVATCAAVGLVALGRALADLRRGGRLSRAWLALPVVAVLPWLPLDPVTDLDPVHCDYVHASLRAETGDIDGAWAGMEAVVRQDPVHVGAWSWLARAHAHEGRPAEALAALEAVLAQHPGHYPARMQAARLCLGLGRGEAAREHLARAFEVPPQRPEAGRLLLELLRREGRTAEAAALLAEHPELAGAP